MPCPSASVTWSHCIFMSKSISILSFSTPPSGECSCHLSPFHLPQPPIRYFCNIHWHLSCSHCASLLHLYNTWCILLIPTPNNQHNANSALPWWLKEFGLNACFGVVHGKASVLAFTSDFVNQLLCYLYPLHFAYNWQIVDTYVFYPFLCSLASYSIFGI